VTIWAPSDVLVERITKGEIDKAPNGKPSKRHLSLREEYRDPGRVIELYERWIDFVAARGDEHLIAIEEGARRRLVSVEDWRRMVASLRAAEADPSGDWPRERIEALTRRHVSDPRRIALLFSLAMPGPDLSEAASRIFPPDLSGKSVIDLNCGDGFFCIEAKRRGAAHVVGIDADPDNIILARDLAASLNLDIDFAVGDAERELPAGGFDYTLCLDLLDRVRDPIDLLDRTIAATSERIVLDTATLDSGTRARLGVLPGYGALLAGAPLMYVAKNGAASKHQLGKFIVTDDALRNLLTHHRRFFHKVQIGPSIDNARRMATADKYRIDHLIVVSAPVSGGKSTFCNKLLSGEFDQVYTQLGIAPADRPHDVFLPRARSSNLPADRKTVLFHYNFLNPYVSSARIHEHDENLDILRTARQITFLTLWASPERLVRQITKSEIEGGMFHRPAKRHLMLRQEYRDPAKVLAHYEDWIGFVERQGGRHFVVDQEGGTPRLLGVEEWRKMVAPLRASAA
jgi:2-polyprenyl-3-methyl-5-hydroxy-6-metoxy-1,4-benzoquinol methylase